MCNPNAGGNNNNNNGSGGGNNGNGGNNTGCGAGGVSNCPPASTGSGGGQYPIPIYDYIESMIPFSGQDACNFFIPNSMICNPDYSPNLSNISISNASGCLQDFWSCYNPTAIVFGINGGAGAGIFNIAGAEAVIMLQNGAAQDFYYAGQGSGEGGNLSGYSGIVFNLNDFGSYIGPFATYTLAVGPGEGVAVSYFHDVNIAPFSPGGVQGFSIGPAAVTLISFSGTRTDYVPFP